MDRFDRIFELHKLLSAARRPVPRKTIEERLECSRATAKRIIEAMRDFLNAPIEYDRQANGYYYASQGEGMFELPGLWFNASELQALLTLQQLLTEMEPGLLEQQLGPLLPAAGRRPGPAPAGAGGALQPGPGSAHRARTLSPASDPLPRQLVPGCLVPPA